MTYIRKPELTRCAQKKQCSATQEKADSLKGMNREEINAWISCKEKMGAKEKYRRKWYKSKTKTCREKTPCLMLKTTQGMDESTTGLWCCCFYSFFFPRESLVCVPDVWLVRSHRWRGGRGIWISYLRCKGNRERGKKNIIRVLQRVPKKSGLLYNMRHRS